MTTVYILAALLVLNAILHFAIVGRFGLNGNMPPLVFGIVYAVLAILSLLQVPNVAWIALIVAMVGTAALLMQFKNIKHETTIEKVILVVNAVIIVFFLVNYVR